MRSLLSLIIITTAFAAPAVANDAPGKTSFALRAGTLGIGAEVSHALPISNLSARIAWNGYTYDMDEVIEGIGYDMELDLGSAMAMLDWRPWSKTMHLTAGLVFNGNEIIARSQNAGTYTVGGTTFAAADVGSLSGRATFDNVVPYAGLGWNKFLTEKTALTFEMGVVFQGAPKLSMQADGPIANDPVFQAELDRETTEFENDIKDYQYYPVVVLGLGRRF